MTDPQIAQPGARLQHHGTGGELFVIFLVNVLLKILTLNIYHFWAKTRVRSYLWSQTSFDGERFEYTGNGLELFIGFLKVVAIYIVGIIALSFGIGLLGALSEGLAALVIIVGSLILYPLLIGAALYGARRYQLTRTRWRGIRFGLAGSAIDHGLIFLGHGVLTLLTLGLYAPFFDMALARHSFNNMRFGDASFAFDGKGGDLFGRYLIAWLLTLPTLGLIWFWYSAVSLRYRAERLRLQEMRFRVGAGAWQLFGLWLTNLLLLVFTFGLAYPWVLVRSTRFMTQHLEVAGDLDYAAILQSQQSADASGEGLVEALDLGTI